MTDAEIKAFSLKHAPKLAESITDLCGKVIAKGLQGILHECVELKLENIELKKRLAELEPQGQKP